MKNVIINVLMLGVGGGIGFFVAKNLYKTHYEQLAQDEIDEYKEWIDDKYSAEEIAETEGYCAEEKMDRVDQTDKPKQKVRQRIDYNAISRAASETKNEESDEEDAGDGSTEEYNGKQFPEPYLISIEDFTESQYETAALYYYRDDEILCEEDETAIDDIDYTIGLETLNELAVTDTVWVRNEKIGIDYEIAALNSSYAAAVHGMSATPKELYEKRKNGD